MPTSSSHKNAVFIISLFLSLAAVLFLLTPFDFTLVNPDKLFFSQASKDGVDINKRVGVFYKAFTLAAAAFVLFYWCFNKAFIIWNFKKSTARALSLFGFTGLACIGSTALGYLDKSMVAFFGLLLGLFLIISAAALKGRLPRNLGNIQLHNFSLLVAVQLCLALHFFTVKFSLDQACIFLAAAYLLTLGMYALLSRKFAIHHRFILLGFSLSSVLGPSLLLGWEAYFLLKETTALSPSTLALALCVIAALGMFFWLRKKKYNSKALCRNALIPAAVLSLLIHAFYQPVIAFNTELFELANPAVAQMRLFKFGELPLLDFMSSHMLSEQISGYFYHLLFGYQGTQDFLVYNFIYPSLSLLCAFAILKNILKPLLALLFLLIFPFNYFLFYPHLCFAVIAFSAANNAIKKRQTSTYIWLFVMVLASIIWRIDLGVALLFASTFFWALFHFDNFKIKLPIKLFKALGIVSAIIVGLVLLGITLNGWTDLKNNFLQALGYVSASQAHGYSGMGDTHSHNFALFHYFLPLLSFTGIAWLYLKYRNRAQEMNRVQDYALKASIFFYLIHIGNFSRALVRHGFLEGSDTSASSSFYLASVLAVVYFLAKKGSVTRFKWLFTTAFFLVLFIRHFGLENQPIYAHELLKAKTHSWQSQLENEARKNRVIYTNQANDQEQELIRFLNKELNEDESFLDFSNTPMLYYEIQRNIPSYFCQGIQNIVSEETQARFVAGLNPKQLPLVVYSHEPRGFWDATDGVENELRYARVAEFIYHNYRPMGTVGSHKLWKRKDLPTESVHEYPLPDFFDYRNMAIYNAQYFINSPTPKLKLLAEEKIENHSYQVPEFWNKRIRAQTTYLELKTAHPKDGQQVNIELSSASGRTLRLAFLMKEKQHNYLLRISNLYEFHIHDLTEIKLHSEASFDSLGLWSKKNED